MKISELFREENRVIVDALLENLKDDSKTFANSGGFNIVSSALEVGFRELPENRVSLCVTGDRQTVIDYLKDSLKSVETVERNSATPSRSYLGAMEAME